MSFVNKVIIENNKYKTALMKMKIGLFRRNLLTGLDLVESSDNPISYKIFSIFIRNDWDKDFSRMKSQLMFH